MWSHETVFPFLNLPEVFLLLSWMLSLFCLSAVYFGTRNERGLAKRILVTAMFVFFCIGFSTLRNQSKWYQRQQIEVAIEEAHQDKLDFYYTTPTETNPYLGRIEWLEGMRDEFDRNHPNRP